MGILAAKAPFNIKWVTSGREATKTVINQQVARYNRDIKLKLALKKISHEIDFQNSIHN